MTKTDAIERSVTVSQPIARVWEALTRADHLARWFGDSAEIDLRTGGAIKLGWSEYASEIEGVIDEVVPPTRFSFSWAAHIAGDGSTWSTKVTFDLTEEDGNTTVTVVETGFAALPADIYETRLTENTDGWEHELADLQRLLEGITTP